MKLFSSKKRVAAIGALTAVTLVGGGMAYGYWTTSGTGTGGADVAAGQVNNLSFVQNPDPLAPMYPGDSAQPFTLTVTNDHADQSAYVTSVGAYITTDAPLVCDGSNFLINGDEFGTVADPTNLDGWSEVDLTAAGGNASTDGSDTVQFNNKELVNQDDCKGVEVFINYVAG